MHDEKIWRRWTLHCEQASEYYPTYFFQPHEGIIGRVEVIELRAYDECQKEIEYLRQKVAALEHADRIEKEGIVE